ncbi:CaiB/BaiF CoA transferase family protein [Marinospirillum alkaliphilum]|uniref:Crotonobetainyl-CoA:carnitine CoA-transferase CaiB n=1 Tax=Marinospirillum alkaliphilum DSM 21637 TaxID=1122209 RepID=A0A1K1XYL9_9GAMM|nr:CaiB/BaiF CoA-transferase family protein [Marinospirillum alkaliphilum]SFX54411.1 Crotonobetainyl-CoA:carnitine CoA-transferase CaiB [Marinospirillum alkaliphilum DSM 21637]
MTAKPLQGIRVLDLSRILAGPWCTQQLADLGAEVIKIEKPGSGDDTRSWGPPWLEGSQEAAYYLSANRGKQSVAIDLAQPEGQKLIHQLVQQCDVLVENFKVGGLKKYGLDYASLKQKKPDLIYCSITGFGQDGPYAHRAGYDFMIQGMGGVMSLTGVPDGEAGAGPMKIGVAFADIFTGLYASNAILAALYQRQQTSVGTHIDLSLLDVQVGVLANQALNYLTSGDVPQRLGNAHPNIVPYQAFATADGHLILAVGNDGQFQRFCQVAGCPELAADERFASNRQRVANRNTLLPLLEPLLQQRSTDDWLKALEAVGVPCGPINRLDQVFADPQVQHRGLQLTLPHPQAGEVKLVSNPVRFDGKALNAETAPPLLGEHTTDVASRLLGLTAEEQEVLKNQGVLG